MHDYANLAELRAASAAVVVGTVVSARIDGSADAEGLSSLAALVTTVHVDRLLAGSVGGQDSVAVRQVYNPGTQSTIDFNLSQGTSYVLFLSPFTFGPDYPPMSQYAVTGDAGAYEVQGGELHRLSEAARLPGALALNDLIHQL